MKTTLEIPGDVFRKLKITVAMQGSTIKKFVTDAVREKLAAQERSAQHRARKELFGAFAGEKKEIRRIQKIIDREFSRIDPEDWK